METVTYNFALQQIEQLQEQLKNHQNCDYWKNENGRVQGQIINVINEYYESETDAVEIVQTLCEIVDYQPKKEIEFTATIRFTGRMDVDAWEYSNNFSIEDALAEAYVDINNGDVIIDGYHIEDAEEC